MGKTLLSSIFGVALLALFQAPTAMALVAAGGECTSTAQCASGHTCVEDGFNRRGTSFGTCRPNKAAGSRDSGAAGGSCVQQADALLQKCQAEQLSATDSCDSKKDTGMNAVINTASPFALSAGANTASSIQAACKGMAGLSQAANAALAAYRLSCNSWIGDCVSACSEVATFLKETNNCAATGGAESTAALNIAEEANELNRSCKVLNSKVSEADQAIANYTQTALNSSQCSSLSSSTDYLEQMCAANPNLIACKSLTSVDCTSSTMATNKVCICAKNPLDPTCSLTTTTATGSPITNDFLNSTGGSIDGGLGSSGDLPNIGIEQAALNKSAPGAPIDGKQGGGAQLGGGGKAGGLQGGGGGGGKAGSDTQVNAGFYGGGGGGSGFGSGGSYRGNNAGGGQAGAATNQPGGPDLRQFLPGAKYDPKARGLAGVSGPDGITGPNSSIWKKIQNRYQVMGPTLLP